MADKELVPKDSPLYQEFQRLYNHAREMRPSTVDRWNGDLYATDSTEQFGALARTNEINLSRPLVLDHLTGTTEGADKAAQAQALATVLHESLHARAEIDDPGNPDAVRKSQSVALDEGLTEYQAIEDFEAFAERTGYEGLAVPEPQYQSAHDATSRVLNYAAENENARSDLVDRALDAPVSMRWNTIADEVVRTRLDGVVPNEPHHQQAARAEITTALADNSWQMLQKAPPGMGDGPARESIERVDRAVGRIEQHYQQSPDRPYGSAPEAEAGQSLEGEQQRVAEASSDGPAADERAQGEQGRGEQGPVDLTKLPPPAAAARLEGPAAVAPGQEQANRQAAQPTPVQQGQVAQAGQGPAGPVQQGQNVQGQAVPTGQAPAQPGQAPTQSGQGAAGRAVPPEMRAAFAGQAPAAGAVQSAPKLGDGSRGSSGAQTGKDRSVGPRTEPTGRDRD